MARFKELQFQLDKTIDLLLSNQNLCKLLTVYQEGLNPLEQPDIPDTSELLFKNIFPLPKSLETQENQIVLLNFWFDNFRRGRENPHFKNYELTFDVLCHDDLWRIKGFGFLRPYAIHHEIDKMFNDLNGFGIGKLSLKDDHIIRANQFYSGYRVIYEVHEQM